MNEEYIALGKRVVSSKSWLWIPGMRAVGKYPNYPVRVHEFGENIRDTDDMMEPEPWGWQQPAPYGDHVYEGPYLPDLTDSATLGCVISLVRKAWGDNTASTAATRELDKTTGWIMDCWDPQSPLNKIGPFKTEAEALVAALEAAP